VTAMLMILLYGAGAAAIAAYMIAALVFPERF
jgi:phage shock protein PspC (stress-responsive transcriptional regulator)